MPSHYMWRFFISKCYFIHEGVILLFSYEQIQTAKSIDLLTYLLTKEPDNIMKSGINEYCLKEHDSLKISNGKWFWHSQGYGAHTALDFLVKVRGYKFKDAVQILLNENRNTPDKVSNINISQALPKKQMVLPRANINNDMVYAYLLGRCIDFDTIKMCIENGLLYESAKTHHCVFVGFIGAEPKYASIRSTTGNIKRDVKNSDKRFGFVILPNNNESRTVAAFESAIDAISHYSLSKINNIKWDGYRLSLDGVSTIALYSFLERNKNINQLYLHLDNDSSGKNACDRIIKEILSNNKFSHIKITTSFPPYGKDYNDTLVEYHRLNMNNIKINRIYKSVQNSMEV